MALIEQRWCNWFCNGVQTVRDLALYFSRTSVEAIQTRRWGSSWACLCQEKGKYFVIPNCSLDETAFSGIIGGVLFRWSNSVSSHRLPRGKMGLK